MIDPLTNESRDLPVNDSNAIIKYLGAPISAKKFRKMQFADGVLTKMKDLIERISGSGLKISQIINAL
jgi:hypothetical protein